VRHPLAGWIVRAVIIAIPSVFDIITLARSAGS